MIWIALFIILAAFIAFAAMQQKTPSSTGQSNIKSEKIDSVFTPADRSFYGVLKQAVGDEAVVLAKVRVTDVLKPQKRLGKSG